MICFNNLLRSRNLGVSSKMLHTTPPPPPFFVLHSIWLSYSYSDSVRNLKFFTVYCVAVSVTCALFSEPLNSRSLFSVREQDLQAYFTMLNSSNITSQFRNVALLVITHLQATSRTFILYMVFDRPHHQTSFNSPVTTITRSDTITKLFYILQKYYLKNSYPFLQIVISEP